MIRTIQITRLMQVYGLTLSQAKIVAALHFGEVA